MFHAGRQVNRYPYYRKAKTKYLSITIKYTIISIVLCTTKTHHGETTTYAAHTPNTPYVFYLPAAMPGRAHGASLMASVPARDALD